jgi:tRNA(Ile2)-agmatinylcytidine synthase
MHYLVGLDDTDSSRGLCTTYLAYRIARDLYPGVVVLPYPKLVRLNPNIPFKTRGNAAVCLRVETSDPQKAFGLLVSKMEELSDVKGGANSGLVLAREGESMSDLRSLYHDALSKVVNPSRVRRFLEDKGVRFATLGNGMGLVGATASLGFSESDDHTFELIAYRRRGQWGTKREVEPSSVLEMERLTFPHTFNSYDHQKGKVLLSPHGPDPVFLGLRGDSPSTVVGAFKTIRFQEDLEGHMVYVSNQHTDAHLDRLLDWKVYSSGWAEGVTGRVETGEGGHVYVSLLDGPLERECAFYEPTGDLHRVARRLQKGDRIRVWGGVRRGTSAHEKILNVEKLQILELENRRKDTLVKGIYLASPRANRHLTKPLIRYGMERNIGLEGPTSDWVSPLHQS